MNTQVAALRAVYADIHQIEGLLADETALNDTLLTTEQQLASETSACLHQFDAARRKCRKCGLEAQAILATLRIQAKALAGPGVRA